MVITVAEAMVQALQCEGVSTVFGYPGAAICPFYDCLIDSQVHHVLVRQEQNAGHAASGYARITGKPGVVVVTSGPGATNLITGLATAYMDSIPLVAITGQVSSELIGRDVFQEADITGAAEPFTKHSYLVKNPADVGRVFKEAFHIASTGRPGPVLIDMPIDVQRMKIDFEYPESVSIRGYKPTVAGNALQIRRVGEAIAASQKPLLCVGGGVHSAGAAELVVKLADQCGIPMVSTLMGLSVAPSDHPLYFGMLGMHGNGAANHALRHTDLLIVIGARVGDRAMAEASGVGQTTRIVHIDVDPAEIGKNLGATIPVVGDAKQIVTKLIEMSGRADSAEWVEKLTTRYAARPMDDAPRAEGFINPKEFLRRLTAKMQNDAVIVADVGQNQIWTASHAAMHAGTRFLTSGGMGTMGYSIPAAIGAQMADMKRQVVSVCGDGSFQMMMCELATMCQENLPVKMIVMRNYYLGMVREVQRKSYNARYSGVVLEGGPDLKVIASAYGIPSARLDKEEGMDALIDRFLNCEGPMLLECCVDPDESTL